MAPSHFVTIHGRTLRRGNERLRLRGVSLGNWLLLEHFMSGFPHVEQAMRRRMAATLGPEVARAFFTRYQESYITEVDFAYIASLGLNWVRLPFNYHLFEEDNHPGVYREEGFYYLDRALRWAERHGLLVLLDLHAAPGGQATDWNADNMHGESRFWTEADNRARTVALWRAIAARYRDCATVLGYDLLCEPVCPGNDALVQEFYRETIAAIREVDPHHLIALEANMWAKEIASLTDDLFTDPQVTYSPHIYLQHHLTFNHLIDYPTTIDGQVIDRDFVWHAMQPYLDLERIERPVLIGECGLRYHTPETDAQVKLYADFLALCEEHDIHWGMWAYKDVGVMGFVTPRAETPWKRFLAREELTAVRRQIGAINHVNWAPGGTQGPLYHQLKTIAPAVDDETIKRTLYQVTKELQTVTLQHLLNLLKEYSTDDLLAMAGSFAFDQCEIDRRAEGLLQR